MTGQIANSFDFKFKLTDSKWGTELLKVLNFDQNRLAGTSRTNFPLVNLSNSNPILNPLFWILHFRVQIRNQSPRKPLYMQSFIQIQKLSANLPLYGAFEANIISPKIAIEDRQICMLAIRWKLEDEGFDWTVRITSVSALYKLSWNTNFSYGFFRNGIVFGVFIVCILWVNFIIHSEEVFMCMSYLHGK